VFGSAPADQITTFVYRGDRTLAEVMLPNPTANNANMVSYTYEFDSLGRPLTIRRPDALAPGDRSGVKLSYDGLTQTSTEVVRPSDGQPAVTKTTKDSFGRLIQADEQLTDGPTPTWASTHYEYDPADNIKRIVDPKNVTTVLAHDFAGRRIAITRAGRTWNYSYDKNGNLLTETSPCEGLGCESTHTTSIAYESSRKLGRVMEKTGCNLRPMSSRSSQRYPLRG
jgi:YD repeat-containing protein